MEAVLGSRLVKMPPQAPTAPIFAHWAPQTPQLIRWDHQGSCHKRQKPQAPTPQAPIRNRQTRKVANAKGLNRNTSLT